MKKFTLLLLMTLFATTASAYTYYNNVEIGNFKYSYLALGSSSSEENYAFLSCLSSTASSSLTTLDIPGYVVYNGNNYRVKKINQDAFHNNTKITNVTFGYGVEYISSYVFDGCTNLKTVNLPSSVKEIGQFVFQNCTSLLVVAFAGDVAPKIYDYTFNLSNSTKRASTATYRGMNALKADSKWVAAFGASNILRHYNGYMVGDFKVYNSTNGCWQYYVIKNGIPYNGNSSNLSKLSSCVLVGADFTSGSNYRISLPQRVGNSDNNAPGSYHFYGVADSAFMGNTAITQVTNNSTLGQRIGVRAFYGCTNLEYADVAVDTIYEYAFYKCSKLATVELRREGLKGVEKIGNFAFGMCGLTGRVNIPATTKNIGTAPFYSCSSLEEIDVDDNNTNYRNILYELYDITGTELIQVPGQCAHYSNYYHYNPHSPKLQRIRQYAAAGCNMKDLELIYNVKYIEANAFYNCKALEKVHFPSSITTVASNAFAYCDKVNCVELNLTTPPTVDFFPAVTDKSSVELYTPHEAYTAYSNSSIWSQYNHKTGIYDHQNCWDLKERHNAAYGYVYYTVMVPYTNNVTGKVRVVAIRPENLGQALIPWKAYNGWSTLGMDYAETYFPVEIGYEVVDNSKEFTLESNASILTIDGYAFAGSKLKNFPFDNVEEIGISAFENTTELKVELDNATKIKTIKNRAFYNSAITKFEAPTTLTSIGDYAFYSCKDLTEIFLPHIDGKHTLTSGTNFFGSNAYGFKCYVDYRILGNYVNSSKWDGSKIYPHLKLDSDWQSFACVKHIDFEGSGVNAYIVTNYIPSEKKAILSNIATLKANNGAVVTGELGEYYRLDYADSGKTTDWMVAVTSSPQTVNSNSTTSYFKLNGTAPQFDKITSNTTFNRGYAYLEVPTSQTGGATTIYTNLSGSGGVIGDVNCDGSVNAADVTALYNYILNGDETYLSTSDVNNDNAVNAGDVTAVYNIILGQN